MTNYMASNPQTVSSARQPFGWAGGRRRGGLPACLLLVCTPAIVAQSAEFLAAAAQAQSRAFIDVQCASEVFVSQPAELVIMIGYDAAWFEAHGV